MFLWGSSNKVVEGIRKVEINEKLINIKGQITYQTNTATRETNGYRLEAFLATMFILPLV